MFEWGQCEILFYRAPVDMRQSIDGLSRFVQGQFGREPCDGAVYVFCNRGRDKIKLLYWERNGFCLFYKRLEKERFHIPLQGPTVPLSRQQLRWLLEGLNYQKLQGHKEQFYRGIS
jgi:transposase